MVTYQQTVSAAGNYDLSAIMTLAAEKARREAARNVKAGYPARYARELSTALKQVWTFARPYRDTVRTQIAIRSWEPEQIEAHNCLIAAELAETAIPPRAAEAIVNRDRAVSLLSHSLMQRAA